MAATLCKKEMDGLFAYRYAVFVERLKWDLPSGGNGLEIDQFDRPDTFHIMAHDVRGKLCGCARLLSTTHDYLLGSVFPELMVGAQIPRSVDVWEISRFCSVALDRGQSKRQVDIWGCREVMAGTVACALEVGARRLVGVSVVAIERVLARLGVHAYRMGPVMDVLGHTVFAFCIEIDNKTLTALGLNSEPVINNSFCTQERLPYFHHIA